MAKRLVRVKLRLAHVRPRIWRTFEMHSTSTLGELHLAIQAVMPWEGYHLYEFVVDGASYVDPNGGWEDLDGNAEAYD
ncbi:MAG: plasmid pRiA4b ORF-3 family protein, partial [Actinobacteria bacterium]|nr:plasmid pRiA4b ORF-3 family protein [Actinomycetota bacterium]MCG2808238.1 plasmid pRiA4b ORF-3 family protein [Coriobacteriia bacterium]